MHCSTCVSDAVVGGDSLNWPSPIHQAPIAVPGFERANHQPLLTRRSHVGGAFGVVSTELQTQHEENFGAFGDQFLIHLGDSFATADSVRKPSERARQADSSQRIPKPPEEGPRRMVETI